MAVQIKIIKSTLQYLYIFYLLNTTLKGYDSINKKDIKYSSQYILNKVISSMYSKSVQSNYQYIAFQYKILIYMLLKLYGTKDIRSNSLKSMDYRTTD